MELDSFSGARSQGRGDTLSVLRKAGADSASALVAVTPDDAYNLRVCKLAKGWFGIPQLAARVNEPDNRKDFIQAGIRGVAVPLSTSAALENAVLRPNIFQLLVDRPKEYDILEVPLRNRALVGKGLRDIRLPGNCLILLIRRNGELVTPRGSTVLQDWDSLTLAGDRDSVLETARFFQSRRGD